MFTKIIRILIPHHFFAINTTACPLEALLPDLLGTPTTILFTCYSIVEIVASTTIVVLGIVAL